MLNWRGLIKQLHLYHTPHKTMATSISFKVAKKLFELGYFADTDTVMKTIDIFEKDGKCVLTRVKNVGNMRTTMECMTTVLDVWLWLWRKKNIRIIIDENDVVYVWKGDREVCSYSIGLDEPEFLIEAVIDDIIDDTNLFEYSNGCYK